MDVSCDKCKSRFKIPDEKIPQGKVFAINCPKCKNKIAVDARQKKTDEKAATKNSKANGTGALIDEVSTEQYDASDKPFDFVEEGVKTVLICEQDPVYKEKIRNATQTLGYHVNEAQNAREALKQMRFHVFDLVILNEKFDSDSVENNHVLKYLGRLAMTERRSIFVALLTDSFRTMDNMAAFTYSVNIVINSKNIDDLDKVIKRGVSEHDGFYRVFRDSMKKTGRL